jgi:small GTP-binding protein
MPTYKILAMGNSGSGRSVLLKRLETGVFNQHVLATIGVNLAIHKHAGDSLQIWDISGQERYHVITRTYYKDTDVFVIAVDICSAQAFSDVRVWHQHILETTQDHEHKIMLLLTKCDDIHRRVVTAEMALALCKELNIEVVLETSSKLNFNVDKFLPLLHQLTLKKDSPSLEPELYRIEQKIPIHKKTFHHPILVSGHHRADVDCFSNHIVQSSTRQSATRIFDTDFVTSHYHFHTAHHPETPITTAASNYKALIFIIDLTQPESLLTIGPKLTAAYRQCRQDTHVPVILLANNPSSPQARRITTVFLAQFATNNDFDAIVETQLGGQETEAIETTISALIQLTNSHAPTKMLYYSLDNKIEEVSERRRARRNHPPIIASVTQVNEPGYLTVPLRTEEMMAVAATVRQLQPAGPSQANMAAQQREDLRAQRQLRAQFLEQKTLDRYAAQKNSEEEDKEQLRLDALPNSTKCPVCMDSDKKTTLFPCGHTGVCPSCTARLVATNSVCPGCRAPIEQWVVSYAL